MFPQTLSNQTHRKPKGLVTVAFPDAATREKGSKIIDELNLPETGHMHIHLLLCIHIEFNS
jgi:hypothetical protein